MTRVSACGGPSAHWVFGALGIWVFRSKRSGASAHWLIVAVSVGFIFDSVRSECSAQRERRQPWSTSRIKGAPDPPLPYVSERIYSELTLEQPTTIIPVPGTDRMIAVQLEKQVISFRPDHASEPPVPAIDLSTVHPEFYQALGIAFHPEFPAKPWCYLTYQLKEHSDHGVRLARFRVVDTAIPRIDPDSELLLASWRNHGHRGACIIFGPDGYLYVPIGDGSPANPPDILLTGQDLSDIQSAILRIDVDASDPSRPYRIPEDNPFVNLKGARGEIWAYGFRNPWKICFHPESGELWAGDVGWELIEMVYRVEKGGNYGWSITEGSQPVHPNTPVGPTPIQAPIVEHSHVEARSVTGGYFYFGTRLPELRGAYIYGDYITGKIWALRYEDQVVTWHREIADTPLQIISFALEPDGELDIVGFDGTIHRLVRNPRAESNVDFPRRLSETGLFDSTAEHRAAPGVVEYSINAEHWADHTIADRLLALPDNSQVGIFGEDKGDLGQNKGHIAFPGDSVLAKTVSLETVDGDPTSRRRLETQILHRDGDTWNAYNYIWNDEQTDAILQEGNGQDRTFMVRDPKAPGGHRQQVWHHASRDECLLCHIWRSGSVHGFKLEQLNRAHPKRDGVTNQLQALDDLGIFGEPIPDGLSKQASPYDPSFPLDARARAYLHLNCAHCHRDGGGGTAVFDIRQHLPLSETRLVNAAVTQGTFGIDQARVVVPGRSDRSVLYYRLAKLGRGHMPQFGTSLADAAGIQLIHDWIESMEGPSQSESFESNEALRDANLQRISRLKTVSRDVASDVTGLLDSTNGALILASAMNANSLAADRTAVVLEHAGNHADSQIRDLFERFLPPEKRVPRLGDSIDTAQLLALTADPRRGQLLYASGAGVVCRNCHQIGGNGGQVGPQLDAVGRTYRKPEILENILTPSRKVDPKYMTYVVVSTAGTVSSGLLVQRSEESVTVRDATGKDTRVPRDEIELLEPQQKSLMPDMLLRDFTAQQAADLLAYLESLKAE